MKIFNEMVFWSGTVVVLISFILAFRLRSKKELPLYFHFFYLIPFCAILFSINGIFLYFNLFTYAQLFVFQHIIFLLEFILTCIFFYKVLSPQRKLVILIFLAASISFIMLLTIYGLSKAFLQSYTIPGLAIFILCMYYYYQLFNEDKPVLNLLKTATFWIVTGLFFYSAITLPIFAIHEYFAYKFGYIVSRYVISLANIIIIAKHIFFIKAYRCATVEYTENKVYNEALF